MVFIYTTCATPKEAERLGELIISQKLGACVDWWPVSSMYNWEGKLQKMSEVMIIISTLESQIETVNDLISSEHTYSIPLIAGVDVRRINRAYKEWMTEEGVGS
ncbi:MAG TPA: divalent-cation tolerance protein CutA [Candidatus Paceibacterota bacterium]|nr:divalent-cation tolerance protein CutA [Candidatus Paceibacterota bacterium]